MPYRRLVPAIISLFFAGLITQARADAPMFYTGGDSAINGFDTVAYFKRGEPVEGKAEIAVMWKGAIWKFASESNREAFEADPRAYAPQYGGYCAYGVSLGYRDTTEPDAWQIVNGKLYLIRTLYVRGLWKQDMAGHIARADANWPGVLNE